MAEMDGWSDGQRTRKESERAKQKDQMEKGGKGERAAQNMRLKCNVLQRKRENPGQVMQLEGTALWQNVLRIKRRRRQQTLFF